MTEGMGGTAWEGADALRVPSPERPLAEAEARGLVRAALLAGRSVAGEKEGPHCRVLVPAGSGSYDGGPCVCAIGSFDGLHRGHQALLGAAAADARERGLPLVAVTFDPDPSEVLSSASPERLLQAPDRLRALCAPGVAAVVAFRFSRELAALDYESYVRDVLLPVVAARRIHVGADFSLGAGRAGTVAALVRLGGRLGFEVVGHRLLTEGGEPVTATRIRGLVSAGDVADAADLLGRRHFLRGSVRHGRGEGTGLGFPTANVGLSAGDALPARGVYAGYLVAGGTAWPAAINMGEPPTFTSAADAMLEANLPGFSGDLYGQPVAVAFVARLRGERTFATLDELRATVEGNIAWVRDALGTGGVPLGEGATP